LAKQLPHHASFPAGKGYQEKITTPCHVRQQPEAMRIFFKTLEIESAILQR
jgi:hypothetical protein